METAALNCALCSLFGSKNGNGNILTVQDAKTHARIHYGQIKMFEAGEIDEEQMFERCFPKSTPKMDQRVSNNGRRSLGDVVRLLLGKRAKFSCIECNLCGNSIHIKQNGKLLRFDSIIAHACIHANVKPFKCRQCENFFRVRCNVQAHFKRVHGTKMTNHDIEDESERFDDEIINLVTLCFTKCENGAPSKEVKNKTREYIIARSGRLTNASELTVQRQLFFNRTIKSSINSDGMVTCHLCSKKIKAKASAKSGGRMIIISAIQHAQLHLRKPLYRCRTCNVSRNTYPAMEQHLHHIHASKMDKNHECFADSFHLDILAIFTQCYAKDGSTA